MKKVSYIQLLKEAITEYDAKVMDYKGPLTEPILTFRGEGELETTKDASSILERYYFNENAEELVEQDVGPDDPVDVDEEADATDPNDIVTGEEADDVDETMKDLEDELMEEDLELEDYDPGDPDIVAKDKPLDPEDASPMTSESEMVDLENVVIEKLIQEMEEEDVDGGEAGTDIADEKDVEKVVGKSDVDDVLEDIDLLEAEIDAEIEDEEEDEEEEEVKDLDVDKEIKEGALGPNITTPSEVEEAFRIFKEQIEEDAE